MRSFVLKGKISEIIAKLKEMQMNNKETTKHE